MKRLLFVCVCFAALGIMSSCGDDDCSPCAPHPVQPLAEYLRIAGGGGSGSYDSLRVTCHYSTTTDTLFDLWVDESDEDYMFTIDASNNPDFDGAIARLTNGTDESIIWWVRFPNGSGGGNGGLESSFLEGGFSGDLYPDLHGAEVTEIRVYIEEIWINVDISFTEYGLTYRAVFMGRP